MTDIQLERQREYRRNNGNIVTKRYEKTPKGFLMRLYRNMLSRISGVQKAKYHLYEGKELLNKNIFYTWAINHPDFLKLYSAYIAHNYNRKLAPSVDRVDPSLGYNLLNMEWVTMSENSRRGTQGKCKNKEKSGLHPTSTGITVI